MTALTDAQLADLSEVARSIRTAQSIAHHRLYEMETAADRGDGPGPEHVGPPAECTRPLCVRLRQDAAALEALACT